MSPKPEPRTLRTSKLRNHLWLRADGRCEICGAELDPDNWHADHTIPWKRQQVTNVHNMQAACPSCNLRKGSQ